MIPPTEFLNEKVNSVSEVKSPNWGKIISSKNKWGFYMEKQFLSFMVDEMILEKIKLFRSFLGLVPMKKLYRHFGHFVS